MRFASSTSSVGGEQLVAAGLVQEELERVGRRGREVAVDEDVSSSLTGRSRR